MDLFYLNFPTNIWKSKRIMSGRSKQFQFSNFIETVAIIKNICFVCVGTQELYIGWFV